MKTQVGWIRVEVGLRLGLRNKNGLSAYKIVDKKTVVGKGAPGG